MNPRSMSYAPESIRPCGRGKRAISVPRPEWILCRNLDEFAIPDNEVLRRWTEQGRVRPTDYLFNPRLDTCVQAKDIAELDAIFHKTTARGPGTVSRGLGLAMVVVLVILSSGCSVRKIAVNSLGDAIANGGSTFSSDDDPELIGEALPFSLKLMESLLEESPDHTALLVAAARGFTQYTYGWVEPIGNSDTDPSRSRDRSKRLYLRARDYGVRALSTSIRDFGLRLETDPHLAVASARKRDVPALYWTAAAWGLAISGSKDDPELLADLPIVDALISRAAELDPEFEGGAIDRFLINYEASRSGVSKGAETRAREHFRRAAELSGGFSAEPFVTAAESLAVPEQDRKEFESLLKRALGIDVNAKPEWRLANIMSQRRARWLMEHIDDFFMTSEPEEKKQ